MSSAANQSWTNNSSIEEIFRVLRFCDPAFETRQVLTFAPLNLHPDPAWENWLDHVFYTHVGPALLDCLDYAAADHAHDLIKRDLLLSREMAGPLRTTSMQAGRKLLLGFTVPSGARVLARMRQKLDGGAYSPNYATVLAARCALFGIAPAHAVAAYLYKEWHCGNQTQLATTSLPDMAGVFEKISHERSTHTETPRLRVVSN